MNISVMQSDISQLQNSNYYLLVRNCHHTKTTINQHDITSNAPIILTKS